ncbi:MAG: hypothetical protein GX675_06370 [Erysipelotrichaceae bacterium]|nr:hypothetical protein [Erysipelotrichaceae bacterium]
MKVSFNTIDITPKRPCFMAGYSREEKSVGVHDPILINTCVFKKNESTFILSVLDSIILDFDFCDEIKSVIYKKYNIPIENITIACIHTHSAPAFFKLAFEDTKVDYELKESAKNNILKSIGICLNTLTPCNVLFETLDIEGIYGNRNIRNGKADKSCNLIHFYNYNKEHIGTILNISTHPTFFGKDNLLLSADIIGLVRNKLSKYFNCVVLATNGTCGDVSTRFYRDNLPKDININAENIFNQIINKRKNIDVKDGTIKRIQIDKESYFDAATDPFWIKMTKEIEKAIEENNNDIFNKMLLERQKIKKDLSPITLTLISQITIIGNNILITLPGDVISSLGLRIKNSFPDYNVILICYANTYCNYMVSNEEYGKYFETFNSRLPYDAADSFINYVIEKTRSLI